jgi:hypothetical protein
MFKKGIFGSTNALAAYAPASMPQQNALAHTGGQVTVPNGMRNSSPPTPRGPDYGARVDGTRKGRGFLGEIPTPDGSVMTEYSIGIDWGEGEQEIPTLVPGLTREQISYLAQGGDPTPEIVDLAINHARRRLQMGLSPFAVRGVDYR